MYGRLLSLSLALALAAGTAACRDNAQHELLDAEQAQQEALEARTEGNPERAAEAQAEATREAENAVEKMTGRPADLVPITPVDTVP